MSNIWNFKDPLRCGRLKLAKAGFEKYGTVIKSGFMKKTVTVRCDTAHEIEKYRKRIVTRTNFQVHDEDEICRTGDKVVIRGCNPVSKIKHYYIRNIIWMVPRHNYTINKFLNFEKRALLYNQDLRNNFSASFADFQDNTRL
jgi:small subunit ribosomal protein S17